MYFFLNFSGRGWGGGGDHVWVIKGVGVFEELNECPAQRMVPFAIVPVPPTLSQKPTPHHPTLQHLPTTEKKYPAARRRR